VGVLAEQGGLDRARMLLMRRTQSAPLEPEAYLDAIRLELSVPSSGSAWRAWLVRAVEGGAQVAGHVAGIVPVPALSIALTDLSPGALLEQADRDAALDLLRLRACALLVEDDARCLDLLDDEALTAAGDDAAWRELCLAVLLARSFAAPHAVLRGLEKLKAIPDHPLLGELAAELARAQRYQALRRQARAPSSLERLLGLAGRCSEEVDRVVLRGFDHDARAQSAVHLAWADEVAKLAPELVDAWCARMTALAQARGAPERLPDPADARARAIVDQAARDIEADARRFLPGAAISMALYRKHARLKLLAGIAEHGPSLRLERLAAVGAGRSGAVRRVLAHLRRDRALVLFEAMVRLARAG